jgi:DNA-binding protein HU-beta
LVYHEIRKILKKRLFLEKKRLTMPHNLKPYKRRALQDYCPGDLKREEQMTKTQTIAALAEKTELTKAQVGRVLEELAALAYKEARNKFVVPGIGKLVLVNRKARIGRNPATGESIQIPAKTVVKFRVAKVCKQAVLSK